MTNQSSKRDSQHTMSTSSCSLRFRRRCLSYWGMMSVFLLRNCKILPTCQWSSVTFPRLFFVWTGAVKYQLLWHTHCAFLSRPNLFHFALRSIRRFTPCVRASHVSWDPKWKLSPVIEIIIVVSATRSSVFLLPPLLYSPFSFSVAQSSSWTTALTIKNSSLKERSSDAAHVRISISCHIGMYMCMCDRSCGRTSTGWYPEMGD